MYAVSSACGHYIVSSLSLPKVQILENHSKFPKYLFLKNHYFLTMDRLKMCIQCLKPKQISGEGPPYPSLSWRVFQNPWCAAPQQHPFGINCYCYCGSHQSEAWLLYYKKVGCTGMFTDEIDFLLYIQFNTVLHKEWSFLIKYPRFLTTFGLTNVIYWNQYLL